MVIPLLAVIALGLVWLLAVGSARARLVDAARETARALARGDDQAVAVARGERIGPAGTRLATAAAGGEITVEAHATMAGPGGLFGWLPGVDLHATAVAASEDAS
jgi:hypothetical protein